MKVRTIPYGYKVENGKTVPDEGEARIVKRIFTAYINGEGLMRIADALTEEKVPVWEGNVVWSKTASGGYCRMKGMWAATGIPPYCPMRSSSLQKRRRSRRALRQSRVNRS